MIYQIRLDIDDDTISQALDDLAANYKLTTFAKVAVESFIATEAGKLLYKSLAAKGGADKRPKRRQAREEVTAPPARQAVTAPVPEIKPAPAPVEKRAQTAVAENEGGGAVLHSTDSILGRIVGRTATHS